MWSRPAVRAALLPLALAAACHSRIPPVAPPAATATANVTARPTPEAPRARVVASVIQPTALLALGDRLIVPGAP